MIKGYGIFLDKKGDPIYKGKLICPWCNKALKLTDLPLFCECNLKYAVEEINKNKFQIVINFDKRLDLLEKIKKLNVKEYEDRQKLKDKRE